jgi:endonuclease III
MTGLMKTDLIVSYLEELIEDAKCELNYNKDYELLIAVMLSAQTTDKRVNMVTEILFDKYKTLKELKEANIKDLEKIVRSLGTYTRKAYSVKMIATNLLENGYNYVPNNREYLESLPGVGRKTCNVVLANLYNEPCIAVDTHVSRVSIRLGLAKESDNVLEIENKLNKIFSKDKLNSLHHRMVLFGRYYCKAIKPECDGCKLKEICKYYTKRQKL